jgi:hypothetical protein
MGLLWPRTACRASRIARVSFLQQTKQTDASMTCDDSAAAAVTATPATPGTDLPARPPGCSPSLQTACKAWSAAKACRWSRCPGLIIRYHRGCRQAWALPARQKRARRASIKQGDQGKDDPPASARPEAAAAGRPSHPSSPDRAGASIGAARPAQRWGKELDRTRIRPEPRISCSDTAHSSYADQRESAMKCRHEPCRLSRRADRPRAADAAVTAEGLRERSLTDGGRLLSFLKRLARSRVRFYEVSCWRPSGSGAGCATCSRPHPCTAGLPHTKLWYSAAASAASASGCPDDGLLFSSLDLAP